MADWDGRGLPPGALARMARYRSDGVRTSLLDVNGAASVESVGLHPVGEVMGSMVQQIGWQGFGGCGYGYGFTIGGRGYGVPGTVVSGRPAGFVGYAPYVDALYNGYRTAIGRMVLEAQAMGADGVVGVAVSERHFGQNTREFVAMGSAVAGAAKQHLERPFVTDLPGADVVKLLHSGWTPVSIAYGISVAIRHDDYRTQMQTLRFTANTEVDGYTELVHHVRADARERFELHAGQAGADGALVSAMRLGVWEIEPSDNHRDHVAECIVHGTTVARFRAGRRPLVRPLTILPLRPFHDDGDTS